MYLTHIDADGNDSPAILIDNATASNRAVNLPEFVNIPTDPHRGHQGARPSMLYRLMEQGHRACREEALRERACDLEEGAESAPDDASVHNDLAPEPLLPGRFRTEPFEHLREAISINPYLVDSHFNLGAMLMEQGHPADQPCPNCRRLLN